VLIREIRGRMKKCPVANSVKAAAARSGYSLQYMRRLLRTGKLAGLKLGQVWLIHMDSFEDYLANAESSGDNRFGAR